MRIVHLPSFFFALLLASAASAAPAGGTADPLTVRVPQERLDTLMERVRAYEPPADAGLEPWKWGVDAAWLPGMHAAWTGGYDWREAEARLNAFPNFLAEIDGKELHFLHEPGSGDNPTPLLMVHGWPYSVLSFLDVVERLAHPERFGGDAADAYDVVVVGTPGVFLSEAPDRPTGLRAFGEVYHRLMTEVLGHERYVTHGGDQGGVTASWMALDFPDAVIGHHVHMFYPRHAESPWLSGEAGPDATEAERAWVEAEARSPMDQLAYILTHVSRGETLAASLAGNPAGQAAWIWDKWYFWTDKRTRGFETTYTRKRLIDEAMAYLVRDSFRTSIWPYMSFVEEPIANLPAGVVIDNPAGVTAWPDPVFPLPPREFVERSRSNLVHYTEPPRGGHFPMVEEPGLFAEDLLSFGRTLRALPPADR